MAPGSMNYMNNAAPMGAISKAVPYPFLETLRAIHPSKAGVPVPPPPPKGHGAAHTHTAFQDLSSFEGHVWFPTTHAGAGKGSQEAP